MTLAPVRRRFGRPTIPAAPNTIAGLAAWWDFSDVATLFTDTAGAVPVTADSDLIARVNDKSAGAHNATQATSGNRPLYRTAGGFTVNGLSVARFDGVDDYLATAATVLTAGSGLTLFQVVSLDDAVANSYSIGQDTSGAVVTFNWRITASGGTRLNNFNPYNAAGTTVAASGPVPSSTAPHLGVAIVDSNATTTAWTNTVTGTPVAFALSLNTASIVVTLGARRPSLGWTGGRFGEIVVYDHALINSERQAVEAWLRSKWAV